MINVQDQQKLLLDISNVLEREIEVYVIGGTALMFLGLKDKTLDVDIVFKNDNDRQDFVKAAKSLGFSYLDSRVVYGKKDNVPLMVKLGDIRIDLFLFKIITSTFTLDMQKRATQLHEFNKKLFIKIANINDILIMKSVTLRVKDEEDIIFIINKSKVDWDIVINEVSNQITMGNTRAILDLGTTLEKLSNKKKANVPREVLDKLWKLLKKQIDAKAKDK